MGNHHHISAILQRKSRKQQGPMRTNTIYPLYKDNGNVALKESYSFDNIMESVYKWNDYSPSIGKNWNQLMSLYEAVGELGTSQQLHEMTSVINNNILPYIDSPSMMKADIYNHIKTCKSDDMKSCMYTMMESINEAIECDRVLKNIDTVSRRFNLVKVAQPHIFYEDSITEAVYNICELIDTYNMDLKNKFCVACESALYSVYSNIEPISEDMMSDKLSDVSVLENVVDYFMINYGRNQIENFIDLIESAAKSDIFIGDQLDNYISLLRKVNGNRYTEEMVYESVDVQKLADEEANRKYRDESILGLSEDLDQYDAIRHSAEVMVLKEFASPEERIKEFITKMKMLPTQSMAALKSAITAILVPCRAEDIGKGTHNALSIIFYAFITLGWFSVGGPLGGIFGSVVSYIVSKASQKAYLKDAITEWREHKYALSRKIKESTDPEKRRRMEAYMDQVDITINNLETRYDDMRERTAAELANRAENRADDPANRSHYRTSQVDPDGKVTPASDYYDDKDKKDEEDTNDYKKDAPSKISDDDDEDFEDDEFDDEGNPKKKKDDE